MKTLKTLLAVLAIVLASAASAQANNGTQIFDGTFSNPLPNSNWPNVWGRCAFYDNLHVEQFKISATSGCNPDNNGNYRTDLISYWANGSSASIYKPNTPTCTSIPVNVLSHNGLPSRSTTWMFAEEKNPTGTPGWMMEWSTYFNAAANTMLVVWTPNGFKAIYVSPTTGIPAPGWHTWSLCQNSGNSTSTGVYYSLWYDGVQQTFNHSIATPTKGPLTGYKIIVDGELSLPLDINDYTGGSPIPNVVSHGDPLIYNMTGLCPGSSCTPPMPPNGWNSP